MHPMAQKEIKYAKTHEWVSIENGIATIGITDHAQDALGDITFVEFPAVGKKVVAGKECGVIESVKAASDIYAPVSGDVLEVNKALTQKPETINTDPMGAGWLIKLTNVSLADCAVLLDETAYKLHVENE
jgi:glycine cleavage system H protein